MDSRVVDAKQKRSVELHQTEAFMQKTGRRFYQRNPVTVAAIAETSEHNLLSRL